MIKRIKILGIWAIFMGIVLAVLAIGMADIAQSNKGFQVQSSVGGVTRKGRMGANMQKYEEAMTYCGVFGFVGVCCAIGGIVLVVSAIKIDKMPIIRRYGKVIEKNDTKKKVIVEFQNGTREELVVEPSVIVTLGDCGTIGSKNIYMVEFKKEEDKMMNSSNQDCEI